MAFGFQDNIDELARKASDNLQRDSTLQYPSSFVASEVQLWVNFKAFSYTSEANARSNRIGLGSIIAGQDDIWIAMPHKMQVGNAIKYEEGESPESSWTLGTLKETAVGWLESAIDAIPVIGAVKKAVETKVGRMDIQLSEAIFAGASLRSFNYRFEMVAKTIEEAENVNKICEVFQKLAYPRAGLRTSKMFHPPLWGIGVYDGTGGSRQRQWDMSPQNSVLTSVNIDKSAGQGGPSAISEGGSLQPSIVSLDLTFTELEPNVRSMEGNDLMSRSRMKAMFGAR